MDKELKKKLQKITKGKKSGFVEMQYKGYKGSINKSEGLYYGKLKEIKDLVTYEAENRNGLKKAFEEAVDDYIETLTKLNERKDQIMRKFRRYSLGFVAGICAEYLMRVEYLIYPALILGIAGIIMAIDINRD